MSVVQAAFAVINKVGGGTSQVAFRRCLQNGFMLLARRIAAAVLTVTNRVILWQTY